MNKVIEASLERLRSYIGDNQLDKVIEEAKHLYQYADESDDISAYRLACKYLADTYFAMGNEEYMCHYGAKLITRLDYGEDEFHESTYEFLYLLFASIEDHIDADYLFDEIMNLKSSWPNKRGYLQLYVNNIHNAAVIGKYDKAEKSVEKAYEILSELPELEERVGYYIVMNQAYMYAYKHEFDKAHKLIATIEEKGFHKESESDTLTYFEVVAKLHEEEGAYEKAYEYLCYALKIADKINHKMYQKLMLKNIMNLSEKVEDEITMARLKKQYKLLTDTDEQRRIDAKIEAIKNEFKAYRDKRTRYYDEASGARARDYMKLKIETCNNSKNASIICFAIDDLSTYYRLFNQDEYKNFLKGIIAEVKILLDKHGFVAKYDDNVFIAFVFETTIMQVEAIANRLLDLIGITGHEKLTLSIGIADKQYHKEYDCQKLIGMAHEAMKESQLSGKGYISVV